MTQRACLAILFGTLAMGVGCAGQDRVVLTAPDYELAVRPGYMPADAISARQAIEVAKEELIRRELFRPRAAISGEVWGAWVTGCDPDSPLYPYPSYDVELSDGDTTRSCATSLSGAQCTT